MTKPIDKPLPFTIVIDTAEQNPWTFSDMRGDAKENHRKLAVPIEWASLGRHPNSNGDYSIKGHEKWVSIERKSQEDIVCTVLGWTSKTEQKAGQLGHRTRFEAELSRLDQIGRFSCVIVESSMDNCIKQMTAYGVKSKEVNAKVFVRSIISYQQRFPRVQWMFCDSRRLAEMYALAWFRRYWRVITDVNKLSEGIVI